MKNYPDFASMIDGAGKTLFNTGKIVRTDNWQGKKLEHDMYEALFVGISCPIGDAYKLQSTIKPNLPWADEHFEERVGYRPINPGGSYKNWPFYAQDATMRKEQGELFSHTYMERFWPKHGKPEGLALGDHMDHTHINKGIRYELGDLEDLVTHLEKDPYSRQAFLPVWFPEDTGAIGGIRVPCTLGYHFILRDGYLHMTYYIRSCDYFRHFRDDIFLAVRLLLWILDKLRYSDVPAWSNVKPGMFRMDIVSLHGFATDYFSLEKLYAK